MKIQTLDERKKIMYCIFVALLEIFRAKYNFGKGPRIFCLLRT